MNDGCPIDSGRMVNFPIFAFVQNDEMLPQTQTAGWAFITMLHFPSPLPPSHLLAFQSLRARRHLIYAHFPTCSVVFICVHAFARSAPRVMSAMQSFFKNPDECKQASE